MRIVSCIGRRGGGVMSCIVREGQGGSCLAFGGWEVMREGQLGHNNNNNTSFYCPPS